MGKVIFVISMSLDGYTTAANQTPENPMGDGGLRLQEWAFEADETNQRYLAAAVDGLGAVITGRRTYDTSLPWWGADGPSGPARRPVFVVTHEAPEQQPEQGVYHFVTDGLESALAQAQTAAGDKDVTVMGGADIGRQYLDAGLLDEMEIHLVPVLLGGGTRMFAGLPDGHVRLEPVDVLPTPAATHLRYRITR
ncbi:dihydrofolate reductase family protein [Dactylosporangium sp. NPDC050688]|uniref:dihydrofolate reductase family protein n=1 Tax=Dactylosporangium sp. NPDC050688 TaxID=3157217 RepID=UPI0033D09C9F